MNLVSFLNLYTFPVFRNEVVLEILRAFDRVVSWCKSRPLYNILCIVSLSDMSDNTVDCIYLIGIGVGARFVFMFVSTFVVRTIRPWSAVGR